MRIYLQFSTLGFSCEFGLHEICTYAGIGLHEDCKLWHWKFVAITDCVRQLCFSDSIKNFDNCHGRRRKVMRNFGL